MPRDKHVIPITIPHYTYAEHPKYACKSSVHTDPDTMLKHGGPNRHGRLRTWSIYRRHAATTSACNIFTRTLRDRQFGLPSAVRPARSIGICSLHLRLTMACAWALQGWLRGSRVAGVRCIGVRCRLPVWYKMLLAAALYGVYRFDSNLMELCVWRSGASIST